MKIELKQSERLKKVIELLNITPNKFAVELGYKRGDIIYQILKEETKMNHKFYERIINSDFPINVNYLKGELLQKPLIENYTEIKILEKIKEINFYLKTKNNLVYEEHIKSLNNLYSNIILNVNNKPKIKYTDG